MYVDGLEALSRLNRTNENIKNNISALNQFWKGQDDICTPVMTVFTDDSDRSGTVKEANKLSADWKDTVPEIRKANEKILKMSDMVMTSAVGAPRPRDLNRQSQNPEPSNTNNAARVALGTALLTGAVLFGSSAGQSLRQIAAGAIQRVETLSRDLVSALDQHHGDINALDATTSHGSTPSATPGYHPWSREMLDVD